MKTSRDPKRIPHILQRIEKIWERCPDLRLGQLIVNCFHSTNHVAGGEYEAGVKLYYTEDDVLIEGLEAMYKEIDKDV